MAKGKLEESFERENERALKLGTENAEHIKNAKSWCIHFRAKMVSAGLLAQMSGLPIGRHAISCQYAEGSSESMNLPRIIPEFIVSNCAKCPYHEPNGDVSWGERIIEKYNRQLQEREEAEQARQNQLKKLRDQILELSGQAKQSSEIDERQILVFIEGLFSGEETKQKECPELLVRSARIGADLFSPVAVDILLSQSLSREFASFCLPICGELAERRDDLALRLKDVACTAIERRIYPELAAYVLLQLADKMYYPSPDKLTVNLIDHQEYNWPIGGPKYPNSNELLLRSFAAEPRSVANPLRTLLQHDDKRVRVNACGVIETLQRARPQAGLDLLPDLVASLDLYDDPYEESADARAGQCIANAFWSDPTRVDEFLVSQIPNKRPAVQQEIVAVYRKLIRDDVEHQHGKSPLAETTSLGLGIAAKRCLEFVKDDKLDLEVRREAAEALEVISSKHPQTILPDFDSLLGYYALNCTQGEPPDLRLGIILPNQSTSDPRLKQLDEIERRQHWGFFKQKLLDVIKKLAENGPATVGETVIRCFEGLDTKTNEDFKSAIVTLLGEIGKGYAFQPRVLPPLMKALMDYESQVIRATAIRSVEEMYRHAQSAPPKNLVDILILHLHDRYVIVHKAAIRALEWKGRWLSRSQTIEALNGMIGWLNTYRNDPYYLDDLCQAIVQVAAYYPDLKSLVAKSVTRILPTNEQLVDEKLAESLTRYIQPDEPTAGVVARHIVWCLGHYYRDRYQDSRFSERVRMFEWLYQIPQAIYVRVKPALIEAAKQIAARDAFESCFLAGLFAQRGDYSEEENVLTDAADSLSGEKRYHSLRKKLLDLRAVAAANAQLENGNISTAQQLLLQITGPKQ